jgi:translation initiation factor IF-1
MTSKVFLEKKGTVIKSLGNNSFLIALENSEKKILAIVTSRFRSNTNRGNKRIKKETKVIVEFPPPNSEYEQIKGRIIGLFLENKTNTIKPNKEKKNNNSSKT